MLKTLIETLFGKAHILKGKELAHALSKKYSPEFENNSQKKVSEKRLTRILEGIYNQALTYKADTGIGVFGVARLSHAFQWELKDLGYSDKFVDLASEGFTVYLARKKK